MTGCLKLFFFLLLGSLPFVWVQYRCRSRPKLQANARTKLCNKLLRGAAAVAVVVTAFRNNNRRVADQKTEIVSLVSISLVHSPLFCALLFWSPSGGVPRGHRNTPHRSAPCSCVGQCAKCIASGNLPSICIWLKRTLAMSFCTVFYAFFEFSSFRLSGAVATLTQRHAVYAMHTNHECLSSREWSLPI